MSLEEVVWRLTIESTACSAMFIRQDFKPRIVNARRTGRSSHRSEQQTGRASGLSHGCASLMKLGCLKSFVPPKMQSAVQGHQQGDFQQLQFEFDDAPASQPPWMEVKAAGVRVENLHQSGGPWMALHLIRTLPLDTFLTNVMEEGRESVPWDVASLILIIARLLEPSSELYISEQ